MINFLALLTLLSSLLIIIFATPLSHIVYGGQDEELRQHVATLMRIMSVNPFLFAIASVIASMQQAVRRFFFVALAPSVYNIFIILGVIYLYPVYGIEGVAFGVVLGSMMALVVSAIGLYGMGFSYSPRIFWRNLGFRELIRILPARSFDQSADYLNNIIETSLASRISNTAAGLYQTALNIHAVPINIISIAISTAAFPKMTERINQGRPDLFRKEILEVLRVIIWLTLPVTAIAYFARGYLVRLIVSNGNATISLLLGTLVFSIFFRSIFHLLSRVFLRSARYGYAAEGLGCFCSFEHCLGNRSCQARQLWHSSLAIAQSLTAIFEVTLLVIILLRRNRGFVTLDFLGGLIRMIAATGLTSIVLYVLVKLLPLRATDAGIFVLLPKFSIIIGGTLVFYVIISAILRLREVDPIARKVKKIVFAQVRPHA